MSGSQQPLLGYGGGSYKIANSLRFRSSASAYLSRTFGAGNQQTWTWSGWVKRGAFGIQGALFSAGINTSTFDQIVYNSTDNTLTAVIYASGSVGQLITTQVFRDPSAWYHIVVVWDSTNATSANRLRMYVNGSQVTAFGTNTQPTQNASSTINSAVVHTHGDLYYGSYLNYFDGYMAEVNFIDGQALTPAAFGIFDANTGVWKPTVYGGTYGTNGFHLNFSNGTSTTTLGYDSSGNGNNWTTNNISLTAGSTYDWMLDSPTPYQGSSYGVGNYCVLMPFTVCNAVSAGWGTSAASDGNLNYSSIGGVSNSWSSFALPLSGKYYAEMRFSSLTTGSTGVLAYDGNANRSVIFYQNGTIYNNNALSQSLTAWSSGDTIGLAINMDASTIQFYRNGSAVGTAESITVAYGQYFIFNRYQASLEANFGQRPFAYTPPSGYKSLCTYNLPTPTIQNGAGYMAATTYTGTGVARSVSNTTNGISFAPDFVWIKDRTTAYSHILFDTIRGAGNYLISNGTLAELTDTNYMSAFTSTGFSVGTSAVSNGNTEAYVAWQWKAGGTAVTNTAGSITSSVSANTTSGFSVVTYTGNGSAGATFGHGLGIAPSMVIVKQRANQAGYNWFVYHQSVGNSAYLLLNSTNAQSSSPSAWNGVSPSSTVVTLGSYDEVNRNTSTFVAYCFAAIPGYSAFGSYTGNGSTDGPFIYCGFRPRWIMVKNSGGGATSSLQGWIMLDTSRSAYNVTADALFANNSNASNSSSIYSINILSNGFKTVGTDGSINESSATYIYAAFAENPFTNALAR